MDGEQSTANASGQALILDTETQPRRMGRPPMEFDQELADDICSLIANSEKGLRTALAEGVRPNGERYPSSAIVLKWRNSNSDFDAAYRRAKAHQADMLGEDILDIIDNEDLEPHDKRIRVDGRKWLMSKLNDRYGDKIDVTSAGEALAAPVLSPVMIDQRVQTLMMIAAKRQAAEDEASGLLE